MKNLEPLKKNVDSFPLCSGVYLMKNTANELIYVGKAKTLRKRTQSYFRKQNSSKVFMLMNQVRQIEYQCTNSEYEALLLEHNLIKKYRPKFNVLLKDDKTFPLIKITKEEYPRVLKTRKVQSDGSEYFGPYIETQVIHTYLTFIEQAYPLRKCRRMKPRKEPCFYYHLGRCAAVCANKTEHRTYMERIGSIRKLLKGKTNIIYKSIEEKMQNASKHLAYEKAQQYKNSLETLGRLPRSKLQLNQGLCDYVHLDSYYNHCCITLLECKDEKVVKLHSNHIHVFDNQTEILEQFLMSQYSDRKEKKQVIVPLLPGEALQSHFAQSRTVKFRLPKTLQERGMIQMAREIAHQQLYKTLKITGDSAGIQALKTLLSLPTLPTHIEGFDIATSSGYHTVAAMVCFINGSLNKTRYRHYTIKTLQQGQMDDFHAISEAVNRRYSRLAREKKPLPDLIVIDGGKGQVNSAHSILEALQLPIPVIGLAKKHEEIFLPNKANPIIIDQADPASRTLQAVRNEAHRFATSLRARKQGKTLVESSLSEISGVGPKTIQKLRLQYPTPQSMRGVSAKTLAQSLAISPRLANAILEKISIISKKPN